MRWLTLLCCMLACIATTLAAGEPRNKTDATTLATEETRTKRDLQFWKEFIAAKLGLIAPKPVPEQDVKIFRLPGFEKVYVRAVPKGMMPVPVPERIVHVSPALLAVQSYLGTETPEETMMALQGVKNLLHSGVLTAKRDLIAVPPPSPPVFMLPPPVKALRDCPEQPQIQVIQKTEMLAPPMHMPAPPMPMPPPPMSAPAPPMPIPEIHRPIQVLPPPAPIFQTVPLPQRVFLPELQSLPPLMPFPPPPPPLVPVIPTNYSYRLANVDGSVTSYLSRGNQELVITETGRPLPAPPSYIIDRFQKILFGMPLGVSMTPLPASPPTPMFLPPRPVVDVLPPPIFPKPVLPIFTEPGDVEVTVKHPNKQIKGLINIAEGTRITKPTEELPVSVSPVPMQFEDIPKLPPPPPELLQRFGKVMGKRPNGRWGYAMNGGKVYYSHLLPGEAALPDPLSSQFDSNDKDDDIKTDEFGKPFISSKIKEDEPATTTMNPDLQPVKKYPPLPTPIAGENEKSRIPVSLTRQPDEANNNGGAFSSYDFPKNSEGSSGFSYTQVNHDGTVHKITDDGREDESVTRPEIVAESLEPVHPIAIFEDKPPFAAPPEIEAKWEKPGYSYTQRNGAGAIKFTGENKVQPVVELPIFPVRPAVIVKPIVPAKSPLAVEDCLKGFSYTQVNRGDVTVTKHIKGNPVLFRKIQRVPMFHPGPSIVDVIKPAPPPVLVGIDERMPQILHKVQRVPVPPPSPAIIDIIKPGPGPVLVKKPAIVHKVGILPPPPPPAIVEVIKPGPVEVKVGPSRETIMFAEPVVSSYSYKQISHSNPQPFTVVSVGNPSVIEVPRGEVNVKVNKHHHRKPDGTVYVCTDVHLVPTADPVIPFENIPPLPSYKVESTVPEGFMYIPPETAVAPLPVPQKPESHFSYKLVSSGTSTLATTSTSTEGTTSSPDSESTPLSLDLNPIVVSDSSNYSYTQTSTDGSSVNIQGNKEQVSVERKEAQEKRPNRGDIPDALA